MAQGAFIRDQAGPILPGPPVEIRYRSCSANANDVLRTADITEPVNSLMFSVLDFIKFLTRS
jgi:hypothetical protein